MSPEQAQGPRGRQARGHLGVRRRALRDAHAAGARSRAKTSPTLLVAVLSKDVELGALPADTPPRVASLIRRCLARDPKQRLRDIGEARLCSTDPALGSTATTRRRRAGGRCRHAYPRGGARCRGRSPARSAWRSSPRSSLGALAGDARAHTAPLARQHRRRRVARDRPRRRGDSVAGRDDARVLRAAGQPDAPVHPQARSVAGGAARRHRGGGLPVLFAGRSVDRVLRRDQAEEGLGGRRRGGQSVRCRHRVAAARGPTTTRSSSVPRVEQTPRCCACRRPAGRRRRSAPSARERRRSAGPRRFLAARPCSTRRVAHGATSTAANIVVAPVPADASAKAGPAKVVVPGAYYGRYVPSGLTSPKRAEREGGHLLYIQQGTLFAVPFDPVRLETMGQGVPVIEGLTSSATSGGAQVDVSREGTLAYVPGGVTSNLANPIDWMTRDGKTSVLRAAKSRVGQSAVLAGRPEDGHGHLRRQAARHLGLRLGPGHADATDVRPRLRTPIPSGRPTASASCSRPTGPSPAAPATCIG